VLACLGAALRISYLTHGIATGTSGDGASERPTDECAATFQC
jgi:hypothetical protein